MGPTINPDLEARLLAWREHGGPKPRLDDADDELRWLALAMDPSVGERPAAPEFVDGQPIRAGYRRVAGVGLEARVEPAFAQALAAGIGPAERRWLFEHLWGVDFALWQGREGDVAELAVRWLRSPGRRLVRELAILQRFHQCDEGTELDGATDVGLRALWAASGADEERVGAAHEYAGSARWLDLHRSIPGAAMARWQPKRSDRALAIAFSRLERGSPYSLRGAAIGWLLSQAVDRPLVEVGGIRHDLREVLPGRLAVAMQAEETDEEMEPHERTFEEKFAARLEEATLLHAALIAKRDPEVGRVRRAWHLARWIHGCLVRSPFVKDDEERLRAELLALLPAGPLCAGVDDDPLHPARFGPDGLRIEDVSLVAGIWAHYGRQGERLVPTPLPLVRAMMRLASRPLRRGEHEAEESLATGQSNELDWTAPHVAPPWVARWMLTEWGIGWLAETSRTNPGVVDECLTAVGSSRRFEWLAYVWRGEGAMLSTEQQARAHTVWREACAGEVLTGQALMSMAVGLLERLDEDDRAAAFSAARAADVEWQPFLFDAWAEAALSVKRVDLAEPALAELGTLMAAEEENAAVRLNAALLLLRRAASVRNTELGERYLSVLAARSAAAPFAEHSGLLREIRRLGARKATVR